MCKPLTSVLLGLGIVALAGCGKSPAPVAGSKKSGPSPAAAAGMVELIFTHGSEKETWIKKTTGAFNAEAHRLPDGKTIRVNAVAMGSGECLDEIIAGTRQTGLTSPASSAYVEMGNAQ